MQGQGLQGLHGFRVGEGANKLLELKGRCCVSFFVALQGKGLVLSRGYIWESEGCSDDFCRLKHEGFGGERWYQVDQDAVLWYWSFFLFSFNSFFLNCRRKGLSVNAHVPHFVMLDIFSCLFKVLKFLTTHPFTCKLLSSRKQPCSSNAVLFLPSSKSSLTQLHLQGLGHLSNPTLSDTSPSPFPPLLISLWLAELYWGSPCPCRGRFQAILPLSWPLPMRSSDVEAGGSGDAQNWAQRQQFGWLPRKGLGCCYFTP